MARNRQKPIRVVVVDDTPDVRDLLVSILEKAEGIEVVGVGSDGVQAVRLVKRLRPDVVTLDVIMPRMDGLEATREIMHDCPTPIVIITAALMRAEEDLTFLALSLGALTVIHRPGLADPEARNRVIDTVRLMADVPVVHHYSRPENSPVSLPPEVVPSLPTTAESQPRVQIVGIAASTGGPGTLARVLGPLPADFSLPILIVQHISEGFATGLAEWLNRTTLLNVRLAGHGEIPQAGSALIAPENYHLQINPRGVLELCKEPPYKGLRPSANYLFHSMARAYGPRAMGIILTGMGDDGVEGLQKLHSMGGTTIAQSEESSVVFGMPGEAVARAIVDQVLNPDQIAVTLAQLAHQQQRESSNDRDNRDN